MTYRDSLPMQAFVFAVIVLVCIAGCSALTGCATVPQDEPETISIPIERYPSVKALCVGIDRVNPVDYGGWSGPLPDCELDAKEKAAEWEAYGIPTTVLLTRKATKGNVDAELKEITADMAPGSVLFLLYSGHGGQDAGTFSSHEYLCMFNGKYYDYKDVKGNLERAPGITVYWICDACHSGDMGRPVVFSKALNDIDCKLFLLAGCAADKTSQSTGAGGAWRLSCSVVEDLRNQSVYQYFEQARELMDTTTQLPVLAEYGPITDADRDAPMLPAWFIGESQ